MIPETVVAMLACARIGAPHVVVFGGFSAEALGERLESTGAKLLVTQDEAWRKGGRVPLKVTADAAVELAPTVEHMVVLRRTGADVPMKDGRDLDRLTRGRVLHERLPIDRVHGREVAHALQKDGRLHDVRKARSRRRQHRGDVPHRLARLGLDAALDERPGPGVHADHAAAKHHLLAADRDDHGLRIRSDGAWSLRGSHNIALHARVVSQVRN
jgi:hypothetical protein